MKEQALSWVACEHVVMEAIFQQLPELVCFSSCEVGVLQLLQCLLHVRDAGNRP